MFSLNTYNSIALNLFDLGTEDLIGLERTWGKTMSFSYGEQLKNESFSSHFVDFLKWSPNWHIKYFID